MIRSTLKRGLSKVLGREKTAAEAATEPSGWQSRPADAVPETEPIQPVEASTEHPAADESAPAASEPAQTAAPAASETAQPAAPAATHSVVGTATDDTAGGALTMQAVQELLDDMVRPALQGDGGDITLINIEDNNIYVQLVGACNTCPSSIMTMKMGVEALLREEFPQMNELIQVDGAVG